MLWKKHGHRSNSHPAPIYALIFHDYRATTSCKKQEETMKNRKSIVLWTLCTSVIAFSILASAYRKSEESIAYNTLMQETYMIRPDSPLLGSPSAPVTIIEFFDPACKTCRRFYPFTQRILSDYSGKVRLFIKYLPVHGETSIEAIRILEAARN